MQVCHYVLFSIRLSFSVYLCLMLCLCLIVLVMVLVLYVEYPCLVVDMVYFLIILLVLLSGCVECCLECLFVIHVVNIHFAIFSFVHNRLVGQFLILVCWLTVVIMLLVVVVVELMFELNYCMIQLVLIVVMLMYCGDMG